MIKKIKKYSFLLIIIISFLTFFSCKKDVSLFYYPEKMVAYLNLNEEQKNTVLPKLNEIQKDIFDFFRKWRTEFRSRFEFDSESQRDEFGIERDKVLENTKNKVNEIADLLDAEQKKKFFNIEIPEIYFEELMMVQMEYQRENRKKENQQVKVSPTLSFKDIPVDIPNLAKLIEKWTVTFGTRRGASNGFFMSQIRQSSDGNPGFPLKIKATLIDPLITIIQKMEKDSAITTEAAISYFDSNKKDLIEIQVSISTSYHESYLDLDNWILYLENDKIEQFEPVKIEKNVKPLSEQSRKPYANFYSGRIKSETSSESPDIHLGQFFGGFTKSKHFSLFFRNTVSEKPIITNDTKFLKLVFLRKIGTKDRAEGKWDLIKRKTL